MFSDIHYHQYASGVTVEDVAAVERSITDYCLKEKVDFCVFGGDRFLSHTPEDWIRMYADREQRYRDDNGIVTFSLVGNHDWWAKSPTAGHSNRFVQELWHDVHPNLVIMDKPGTYEHVAIPGVAIHALPATYSFDWSYFKINPNTYNVLLFHDLLEGAQIDVQTGYRAPKGVSLSSLDHAAFDCVLGGDVHLPQPLPFKNTRGGYVGAPIQQSRRDRGDRRGWLHVTLIEGDFATKYIDAAIPRFVDAEWDVDTHNGQLPTSAEVEALTYERYGESCTGNIVDLIMSGSRSVLDNVSGEYLEKLRDELGARRVNPPTKRVTSSVVIATEAPKAASPVAEFEAFLRSGRVSVEGLDVGRLLEKVTPIVTRLVGGS